ncbi:MAG: TIGR03936 family radical SAM-associated protein [Anaerolineae bacterium]
MEPPGLFRLRLTFSKGPQVKYISHLDLVRAWERAFRRAGLPLAYSKGFNPQARVQLASGLPLGYTGSAELMDILITEPMSPDAVLQRVRKTLPSGLELLRVEPVEAKSPALQHKLRQAEYRATVETDCPPDEIRRRIEALLAAGEVLQTRIRRKREETFDLRPLLHGLRLEATQPGEVVLWMRLSAGQFGNLRPDTVLEALGLGRDWAQIERICLIFDEEA